MTHPHSTASIPKLLMKLYHLGWYVGITDLCTITMEGGFEHNLSCRATEDWGIVFKVVTKEVRASSSKGEGKVILKATENKAEVLEDAIRMCLRDLEEES